jgi:hypothetical protein
MATLPWMVWGRALLPVQRAQLASCRQPPNAAQIGVTERSIVIPNQRSSRSEESGQAARCVAFVATQYSRVWLLEYPTTTYNFYCPPSLIFQAALRGILWLEFLLAAVQQLLSFAAFALELHMTRKDGTVERVARVVFWDAYGAFFVETFGHQIPVVIAEELMIEAKATIKIR